MPNTQSTPTAAANNTAPSQPGAEPRLISAVSADGASPQFKIPVSSQAIQSVESVDLDLVLTTTTGEKIILQQGALQAATAPDSKIVFQNGDSITAADQIKKLGVLKPVEGGSFRLKSGDASPAVAELVTGDGFGLGKELQDTMSQLTETSKQLEKVLQTLSTATLSNTADDSKPITAGPGTGTGVQKITPQSENKFASPSPGSPPQPEVEKFTSNNTDSGNLSNIKITSTLRGLYGAPDTIISNVRVVDKIQSEQQGKEVLKAFSQASLREMLPSDPLQVRVSGSDLVALEPNGLAHNTLVMPGVLNASSIRFELPQGTVLPDGFQIAGQTFSGSSITIAAESLKDLSLAIQWKVADLGASITKTDFQLGVKYLDNKGAELEQGRAPLTFTYGELKTIEDTVQLDANSNTKIFLSAYGYSYKVEGDAADNNITAGVGNDYFSGGGGRDTLNGGAGLDTVDYAASREAVTVDVISGFGHGGDAEGDRLSNIEKFIGSSQATDTLSFQGTNQDAIINLSTGSANVPGVIAFSGFENVIGGSGNDRMIGDGKANKLEGGLGNDTLVGGAGADTLLGGAGDDLYEVDDIKDVVAEAKDEGIDTVEASISHGLDEYFEHLKLTGLSNIDGTGNGLANTLTGNSGNNRLDGRVGADTMIGGLGDDTYVVDNANDFVTELANQGTDTVEASVSYALSAHVENLILKGEATVGSGNDLANTITANNLGNTLNGGAGNDALIGGDGNDTLNGGINADSMSGGKGDDTYIVDWFDSTTRDVVTEQKDQGNDTVRSSVNYSLGVNVENLVLTDKGNISGSGNDLDNEITGNSGNNTLIGGKGADTIDGGGGNNTASYSTSDLGVIVSLVAGATNTGGHAQGDVLSNIHNLIGSGHNDTLTGNDGANRLDGGDGADTLNGGGGADSLFGGAGIDQIFGGLGDDLLHGGVGADALDGGDGNDTASYAGSAQAVTVSLLLGVGSGGDAQGDTLSNIENLIGSDNNDTLTGDTNANRLEGGRGNDRLNSGGGADTLVGGLGDDVYEINGQGVTIVEDPGEGTDLVESTIHYALGNHLENLRLMGSADLNGTGNTLNNLLTGNAGNNILDGGDGWDTLIGGAGNDSLIGGAGNDSLQGGAGNDTLIGGAGDDTLDLHTGNMSPNNLVGDRAEGGEGNDTVIINQSALGGSVVNLNGGTGTDTLRVFGSTGVNLDLTDLNAKNFEKIDLRGDGASTQVSLSKTDILALVDSGSKTLTLRLDSTDSYVIEPEIGISVTQGQSVSFYTGTIASTNLVAEVKFEYA